MEVRAQMVKFGSPHIPSLRNHLITLYSQWRQFGYAQKLVDEGSTQISISYSKLFSQCIASKSLTLGMVVHAHMIKFGSSQNPSLKNYLITLYSKSRQFGYARKLVEESSEPDLVSWSALISGYAQNGPGEEALLAFSEMRIFGVKCNEFTFLSVLKACSIKKDLNLGKSVHGMTIVPGFESDVFVANTLVFMYSRCGQFGDSRRLFGPIIELNVVSWNALLSCYVQSDLGIEALDLFREMVQSGIRPNEFSLSIILNACAGLQDGNHGRTVHAHLLKLGYNVDLCSTLPKGLKLKYDGNSFPYVLGVTVF